MSNLQFGIPTQNNIGGRKEGTLIQVNGILWENLFMFSYSWRLAQKHFVSLFAFDLRPWHWPEWWIQNVAIPDLEKLGGAFEDGGLNFTIRFPWFECIIALWRNCELHWYWFIVYGYWRLLVIGCSMPLLNVHCWIYKDIAYTWTYTVLCLTLL